MNKANYDGRTERGPGLRTRRIMRELPCGSRSGGVLVLALLSVLTVAGLSAAFLQLSTSVSKRQVHMRDRMRAFYAAEAGLSEAWAGVQIGKTGAIGTEADPALFGDGLFWVEAIDEGDFIRLESTGMVASANAELGLVVEKGKVSVANLGVHADGALDLPPGTTMDGYDSRLGYEPEGGKALTPDELEGLIDDFNLQSGGATAPLSLGGSALLGGQLGGKLGGGVGGVVETGGEILEEVVEVVLPAEEPAIPGRIGSGAGITVSGSEELPTTITADLVPGPNKAVTTTDFVTVTGDTEPAPAPVPLPVVEVPTLPALSSVSHSGRAPMLVLPTEASLPTFMVGPDAEVIVEGPTTLVVDNLVLADGAKLYMDTRRGPVEIFVKSNAVMAPTAKIANPSEDPTRLSLQISAEPTDPISLPAGCPIHGMIYAPNAALNVPPGFELFGSLVAGEITFAGPPKLHFDQYLEEWTADRAKPRLLSWRINELENDVTGRPNPFIRLGVVKALLRRPADAHQSQPIDIVYEDTGGFIQSFTGAESAFDWGAVKEVKALDRNGELVVMDGNSLSLNEAPRTLDPLSEFIDKYGGAENDLVSALLTKSPLSLEALQSVVRRQPPLTSANLHSVLTANLPLRPKTLLTTVQSGALTAPDLLNILMSHSPGLDYAVVTEAQGVLPPGDFATLQGAQ